MTENNLPTNINWVRLASLLRPQGRRGELLAELLTDFPERFAQHPAVFLVRPTAGGAGLPSPQAPDPQPMTIESHWLHKGRVVLKFAGVDSITEAEALRGLDVVVAREERVPLEDGSVYIDDLIGCALVDTNQAGAPVVGTILDVEPQSQGVDLLVVKGTDGGEILIPFAKAYGVRVDMTARRVEMAIPAGLLTVNSPLNAEEQAAMAAQREENEER